MDLRQLNTFRTVVELGSLSKASDRLRIAQPALSRQIRLLEHELKTPLFVRHGRGMVPTEAGRLLFDRTAGLVRALEQARDDVAAAGAGAPGGRVVVGMVPTISGALAATVAKRVVAELPAVHLRMVDAYGNYLVDWLHRGEIDLAVIYGPADHLHLTTETLRNDELMLVGAPTSISPDTGPIRLADLDGQPVVLPSSPHGLRATIDAACRAAGVVLDVRVEADSFQALIDIVMAGVGLTFLPYYAIASRVEGGALLATALTPRLGRELVLAMPARQDVSRATRMIAAIVREEAAHLGDSC